MNPSLGRIVLYRLTDSNALDINRRISDGLENMDQHRRNKSGVIVHAGSKTSCGETFPALVVKVRKGLVSLQVFIDGNHPFWVTGVSEGQNPGNWAWPPRV